jgi:hypothetical protein
MISIKAWIKAKLRQALLWSGVQAHIDAVKEENTELKAKLQKSESLKKQLAERLRSTIEGRDTWRDTAISYRRSEQYHIHKYERVVEQMATLIRFDLSRKAGLVAMERADDGEYVKWKALNELITP